MSIFNPFGRRKGGDVCQLEIELDRRNRAPLTRAQILAGQAVETAIEFICGKPGGGKSMYATRIVVDELRFGKRFIVTNLALNIGRLQEYLDELGAKVNVVDRVRLLTDSEICHFYLLGPLGVEVEARTIAEGGCDWSPFREDERTAGGIMYVIDECHNFFHPQAAALKGFSPEHPMFQAASQHRKLKERWLFVTQSVENVHVAIRRLAQQFNYIRNLRKEKFRGFRRGSGFLRTVYLSVPTSTSAVPIDEDKFSLDVAGLGSCYDTAGGVGIAKHGAADGGAAAVGFDLKWVWGIAGVALAALMLLLFVVPRWAIEHTLKTSLAGGSPAGQSAGRARAPVVSGAPVASVPVDYVAKDEPEAVIGVVQNAHVMVATRAGWSAVRGEAGALFQLANGLWVRKVDVWSGSSPARVPKGEQSSRPL